MYSLEKSITKSIKYPIFGLIASFILKVLDIAILGLGIQFPKEVQIISQNPQVFLGLAVVIFMYDVLKHKVGIKLP